MLKTVWKKFKESYYLDYRAMGFARILISIVLIINLIIRLTDLEVFYTNNGILPLQLLFEREWNQFYWSFHTMSGLWGFQLFLFIVALVFATMMLVGYRTKLATFMSWALLLSLDNRNPLILQGGDDLLRIVLFIAIFLPWNRRYSIDNIHNNYKTKNNLHASFGGVTFILLTGSVYFFSALLKNGPEWHADGTALYYAYHLDQLTWPLGRWLLQFPELLKVLTRFSWYLEIIAPVLLIIPSIHKTTRIIGVFAIIALHIGIASSLFVGLFGMIGISTSIMCIPGNVFDFMESKTIKLRMQLNILFSNLAEILPRSLARRYWRRLNKKTFEYREAFLIVLAVFLLTNNINTLHVFPYKMGDNIINTGNFLRITQNWGMFAPSVFKDDGWYIYEATPLSVPNDSIIHKIDLYRNAQPVTYEKPDNVLEWIKNDRWRKYTENYLFVHKNYIRPPLCSYVRNNWNKNNPDNRIGLLQIIYMKEISQPPNAPYKPATREMLCDCN